jgi:endonuclease III
MARESAEQRTVRVKRIIAILKKAHPDARLALEFSNPRELLIALILAAQARDDLVNSVTAGLFRKYPDAAAWAGEEEAKLQQQLSKINFYRNKTRSIQSACRVLAEKFEGKVPDRLDDLLSLPGVGRKTANIVLGNAFGKPAIGVDTHVSRVSQRLGLTRHENPDEIEPDLAAIVPKRSWVKFGHLLQFHGRRICTAPVPRCYECSVRDLCSYPHKTKPPEMER